MKGPCFPPISLVRKDAPRRCARGSTSDCFPCIQLLAGLSSNAQKETIVRQVRRRGSFLLSKLEDFSCSRRAKEREEGPAYQSSQVRGSWWLSPLPLLRLYLARTSFLPRLSRPSYLPPTKTVFTPPPVTRVCMLQLLRQVGLERTRTLQGGAGIIPGGHPRITCSSHNSRIHWGRTDEDALQPVAGTDHCVPRRG